MTLVIEVSDTVYLCKASHSSVVRGKMRDLIFSLTLGLINVHLDISDAFM